MSVSEEALAHGDLERLDALVEDALLSGDQDSLPRLGFGEISLVLGWPAEDPRFACKRLPPFPSRERLPPVSPGVSPLRPRRPRNLGLGMGFEILTLRFEI